jgi:predicted phosphoribosyltransferase
VTAAFTFSDLATGGCKLAAALTSCGIERDALVLGIVRGGVPAACKVALKLDLLLDVLLLKPLIAQPSGQILRAAHVAGTTVLDEGCQTLPAGSVERLVVDEGVGALRVRAAACRGPRPAIRIASRTIVLIDNGMRTGLTMAAAISMVRAMNAKWIVAATPVASAAAVALVEPVADQLLSLATPPTLGNVAMAYRRFEIPNEARIRELVDCSDRSSRSLC